MPEFIATVQVRVKAEREKDAAAMVQAAAELMEGGAISDVSVESVTELDYIEQARKHKQQQEGSR